MVLLRRFRIANRVPIIGEIISGSLESEKSGPYRSIADT